MRFIKREKLVNLDKSSVVGDFTPLQLELISTRVKTDNPAMVPLLHGFFSIDSVDPFELPDMDKAVSVLVDVRKNDGLVVCVVDYDADGISSGAVLQEGLSELGINVGVMVTDRYSDGYGFSEGACNKILAMDSLPDVLVTADLGSSDGVQLSRLQEECKKRNHDIKIIVTDHHHISKETPPIGIDAFINPGRKDAFNLFEYAPCGAGVAWLLIKALSSKVFSNFDPNTLIDFVGVATVGDMVSLLDPLNRAFVSEALLMMNGEKLRYSWSVLKEKTKSAELTEETIGFKIAPRINALSRMGDDGQNAVAWLTSKDSHTVEAAFTNMDINNEDRKEEQLNCQREALVQAKEQVKNGAYVCVCYVPDYTHGVVGLAASHIVTELGVPAIVFSTKGEGNLTGSARSIAGFDIRSALESVQNESGLLKKYGGHTMAAGASVSSVDDINALFELINKHAAVTFKGVQAESVFYHDGDLPEELKNISGFNELRGIAPFGQDFAPPSFLICGLVSSVTLMGAEGNHARISLMTGEQFVWFKHEGRANDLVLKPIECVVTPSKNIWNNKETVQFIAQAVKELSVG